MTKAAILILAFVALLALGKYLSLMKEAADIINAANEPVPVYPDWGNDMSDQVWKPTK